MKLKEVAESGVRQIVRSKPLTIKQQRRLWARALVARDAILTIPGHLRALYDRVERIERYLSQKDGEAWEAYKSFTYDVDLEETLDLDKPGWVAREDKVIKSIQKTVERQVRSTTGATEEK